jgi:hypothetical protein
MLLPCHLALSFFDLAAHYDDVSRSQGELDANMYMSEGKHNDHLAYGNAVSIEIMSKNNAFAMQGTEKNFTDLSTLGL